MLMLQVLWHWYTTVPGNDAGWFWDTTAYHDTLIVIASIAVVVWTGGLIAYQIKKYIVATSIGLDLLQNAFMGPLFALVESPLWLRFTITIFWVHYIRLHIASLRNFRDFESSKDTLHKRFPDRDDDNVRYVQKLTRQYSWWTLGIVGLGYPLLIIWPSHAMMAFGCLGFSYFGMQSILMVLNGTEDKLSVTDSLILNLSAWLKTFAEQQSSQVAPINPWKTKELSKDDNVSEG